MEPRNYGRTERQDEEPDLKSPMWWLSFFLKQGLLAALAGLLLAMQFGFIDSPSSRQQAKMIEVANKFIDSADKIQTQQAAMARALEAMAGTQQTIASTTAERNAKLETLLRSGLATCRQVARYISKSQDQYEKCDDTFRIDLR